MAAYYFRCIISRTKLSLDFHSIDDASRCRSSDHYAPIGHS